MISCVQVTVQYNLYIAYVMMRKWESGSLASGEDLASLCVKFSSKSEYKFCPGLNPELNIMQLFVFILKVSTGQNFPLQESTL